MPKIHWKTVLTTLLLPIVAGTAAALVAQGFVAAVVALNDLLLVSPTVRVDAAPDWLLVMTVAVPALGGLAVGLLRWAAGDHNLHGPAELIETVQTRRGHLPRRAGAASASSGLLSLGSGAAVGEYGPLVHMGGSLGSALARIFRADITTINIAIACGVAAAISTVFNAPMAGILFAHEIILRHFAPRAFAPVALASIMGYIVAHALSARGPMLGTETLAAPHLWEFGLFVLLGVLGAGVAIGFMQAILGSGRLAGRIRLFEPLKPALAGLILGLAALQLPEVLGMGFELLRSVTLGQLGLPASMLALILAARLAATAMCLGFGFTGGVFSPAMVVGALFGALFGTALGDGLGMPVESTTVYAICGMVAVTAPVIGAPVTAVVIVMELTGSYTLTLAALASVGIANFITARLYGRCLFDRQLKLRKVDLSAGRSKAILESRPIDPLVTDRFVSVGSDTDAVSAREAMIDARRGQAFLVDGSGTYQGSVRLEDLMCAEPDQPALELRNRDDIVMLNHLSLWRAMHRIRRTDDQSVAVVDDQGALVGALHVSELVNQFLDIQADLREEEQIRTD
ncbi:MAG: chloride channel protein [Candidatus Wenzhouxiangella sp. M2_3B_020]